MAEFDYIVVGGGSSGCVVAARLSENPSNRVLLIESGRRDENRWIHIPATFFKVLEGGKDAQLYASEPEKHMNGRPNLVPQGHVIGGGSSVNAMIYIRGASEDYNTWSQLGCRNWSYEKVLPVFRALEGNQSFDDEFHGTKGPLKVSDKSYGHVLCEAFVEAAQQAGLPHNLDFNGKTQEGVGFYQVTTSKGRRWSAAMAFLRDAEKRPNLKIMTETRVARVLFDGNRASDVLLENGVQIKSNGEIILCAGALATPKLLQLSGVGNGKELRNFGIDIVSDVPGVGENYQDHMEAPVQGEAINPISILGQDKGISAARHMAQYLLTKTGLLTSNVVECGGFADVSGAGQPDIQFHVLPSLVGFIDRPPEPGHGLSIGPCILRPKSRGTVKLRSPNPKDTSLFKANTFADVSDLDTLVRGVQLGIRILEAPALAKIIKRRVIPKHGIEKDHEALSDYVRTTAKTVFHPAGTCKMGHANDRMAVVDEALRVRGVTGLRVADVSIMPTLVSGNTNAPAMMIGERAARFILGKDKAA
jgi:choline dehydrogenase